MDRARTIEGRWWIQGDEKPADFGTVSYDPEKGLSLIVKVPRSRNSGEDCIDAEVPDVVHGTDEHNEPVTLFGCRCESGRLSGLYTYLIKSCAGILNFRASSSEDAKFSVACVRYTLLSQWTDRHPVPEPQSKHPLVCFKVGVHNLLEIELSSVARLKIEETIRSWPCAMESRIEMRHCAWFLFSSPTPVGTIFTNYARVLCRLLCLLSGERAFIERIYLYDHDPSAPSIQQDGRASEFLMANDGVTGAKRDVYASRMIASFKEIESEAGSIFKRWFECHEQLGPVVDLYFAIVSNPALIIENRFLFLAQALEVYHARSAKFPPTDLPADVWKARVEAIVQSAPADHQLWLKEKLSYSNQKTLAQRLTEILSLHGNDANRLTAGIADFAAKVRHGRNYYTHYDEELRRKGKVPEALELARMTFALQDLLHVCLLKELCLQRGPIKRILEDNSSWSYFNMDGAWHPPRQC